MIWLLLLLLLTTLRISFASATFVNVCLDNPPDFIDKDGDGCVWYEENPDINFRCERHGDYGQDAGYVTANQAW